MKVKNKFIALLLLTFASFANVDSNTLFALEDNDEVEQIVVENEDCIIRINSSYENLKDAILNKTNISIDGTIIINNETLPIDNYLNYNSISRYDIVEWLYNNSVLTVEQKIDCYCELLLTKNFENIYCLTGIYNEILEYQRSSENFRTSESSELFSRIDSVFENEYINNSRQINNKQTYSSTNFRIHYDGNRTTQELAEDVAEYFEYVREEYINMGFEEAILEPFMSRYQVYLDPDPSEDNYAAATYPNVSVLKTCSSHIKIFNFTVFDNYIKEIIAHEYFHAIQNAYNKHHTWFSEATASWAITKVCDDYTFAIRDINRYISEHENNDINSCVGGILLPVTIEKEYGGYAAIRKIYEEFNNHTGNIDCDDLNTLITNGIINNGYVNGSFNEAYVILSSYIINSEENYASILSSSDEINNVNMNNSFNVYNNNVLFTTNINLYCSKYYKLYTNNNIPSDLTLNFTFDYSGARIQIYIENHNDTHSISYYDNIGTTKTINIQNMGTTIKNVYVIISNVNNSSTLSANVNVLYNHDHDYIGGCTSNDALNHTCICSCGYTYTAAHTYKPFSNGNKCTRCGFFTTGPVITPIMGIGEEEPEEE